MACVHIAICRCVTRNLARVIGMKRRARPDPRPRASGAEVPFAASGPYSTHELLFQRAQGRYLGIGLGNGVKGTGRGPFESGIVRIGTTGKQTQVLLIGVDVIGGDVVEVAPQYDATTNTAQVAAQVLFEIFCLSAAALTRRRKA